MKKKRKMYLWVWNYEDTLKDYTHGIAFAIAPTAEIARKLVIDSNGYADSSLCRTPMRYPLTKKIAFTCSGGG
jgi:hypothetical protein